MPRSTELAFIGLGANLGDARGALDAAFVALAGLPHTTLQRASSLYRSSPVDSSGPDYLNAVVQLETRLTPRKLLAELQRIELTHGRERPYRNAPRTLDLDLLVHGSCRSASAVLTLPHPRLQQRAFVLRPLAELAPELVIAGVGAIGPLLLSVAAQRAERVAA
jgi:2-amino-4-hydroxy-6-hydroxymethyldihydropteridine diphosphokinase